MNAGVGAEGLRQCGVAIGFYIRRRYRWMWCCGRSSSVRATGAVVYPRLHHRMVVRLLLKPPVSVPDVLLVKFSCPPPPVFQLGAEGHVGVVAVLEL
ncbi:MAG: hypothetical protein IPJ47_17880 [Anaerolineales bacterium]|nr:hypothetical protein [Anaerolineales bacterium]